MNLKHWVVSDSVNTSRVDVQSEWYWLLGIPPPYHSACATRESQWLFWLSLLFILKPYVSVASGYWRSRIVRCGACHVIALFIVLSIYLTTTVSARLDATPI